MTRALAILLLIAPLACGQSMEALFADEETVRLPAASSSWWLSGGVAAANCVAAYAAKGAASLAASYTNVANPGVYTLQVGDAPAWHSATGWVFNGSSDYLRPELQASIVQNWSMIVKYNSFASTNYSTLAGGRRSSAYRFSLFPYVTGGTRGYHHGSSAGTLSAGVPQASGVMAFAGRNAYFNGANEGTIPAASTATYTYIHIGAWNNTGISPGTASAWFGGVITSIAIYDATLTQAQVQAIGAAMP